VIETARAVVRKDVKSIAVDKAELRPGDPAVLVADAKAATEMLDWLSEYSKLEEMVERAWAWESKQILTKKVS